MQKFLIIQTAFIGDVVLATSLVENIHAEYPEAQIDFVVRKGNEGLLKDHPLLKNCWIWNKKEKKISNLLKVLSAIRKVKYDVVINVQRYAATGFLTAFSGAKKTIGFDKNPLSFLFSVSVRHIFEEGVHETERNHRLISSVVTAKAMRPKLYPSEADEKKILPFASAPFITISPASVWYTKQYPPQKWADLINHLPEKYTVYLLGGKDDRPLAETIIGMTGTKAPISVCGELNFLQSAALMKHAAMNYVNDSAPMHFASATNAAVTVVYCSTVPAFGYGPLSDNSCIVEKQEPLACRPCGLHGHTVCPQGHFKCALDISTHNLLDTLNV